MIRSFLFDRFDPLMIDGTGIQPDPELAARNLERAKKVIAGMGSKWCCWNPREAGEEELMQSAHSHTVER